MGLDGIELLMAVEEEFKMAIPYGDAAECVTVGKLVDLVYSRLQKCREYPCASQHGFYVIRSQLMKVLGVPRAQIKPETNLIDLLGRKDRKQRWQKLLESVIEEKRLFLDLVRPNWLIIVLLLLMFATCLGLVMFTWLPFICSFVAALAVGFIGSILTIPFKYELPKGFKQVKDLIPYITTLDTRMLSKEEVFQKIRAITVEQLGVNEAHVTLDAKFVDDLGAGV
jgi:acyl carrier protein